MMRRGFVFALLLLLLLPGVSQAAAETSVTVIHAGTLLAVPGEGPARNQSIVIEDGRIRETRRGFASADDVGAPGATVIDLSEFFVLPGLMDMHTHINGELSPDSRLEAVTKSNVDYAMDTVLFARRTLEAGFTTIRNVGGIPEAIFGVRDAVAKGIVAGPRIVAAGNGISGTGGHADTHGYREEILDLFTSPGICNGADDCRRAVRALVKRGSDLIKITATGGVLSNVASGTGQQLFDDELAAIMETAHALGRKVAAHAHQANGINAALRAGVDSIDHGTLSDDESIRLFLETGAYLVPTLLAGHTVEDMVRNQDFLPEASRAKAEKLFGAGDRSLARAYAAGVKIAFGTDSGVSKHGINAQEFALMVAAGMTPMDAIKSATVNTADLLGLSDEIGTLEPGKAADVIAVRGSPLDDVSLLETVRFVMRSGVVYKSP